MTYTEARDLIKGLELDPDDPFLAYARQDFAKARALFTEEEYPQEEYERRVLAVDIILRERYRKYE